MKTSGIIAALFITSFALPAIPVAAAEINGSWSGSGYIHPRSGNRERVRCVVRYSQQSSRVFGVSANCASSSGSIRQTGEVLKVRSNTYVGDFHNRQFDIRGRVRVQVSGGRQTVTFSSSDGSGRLSLRRR